VTAVRRASVDDAAVLGRLLHAFNREYDEETLPPEAIADRLRELLAGAETIALLAGPGPEPDGFAVLRLRPALASAGLECYLAELYVIPERRRHGLGLALMEETIATARAAGADYLSLDTSEADVGARALYERVGLVNREGGPDGPISYCYERAL
jgi:ribosomal protein S18 acetylase RimI-like enzyme